MSFQTYLHLHDWAVEASALSWHLTNKRDRGRITTRDWNRSLRVLAIVNSAGWEIARFLGDTAVHQPIQSVFLIFHQSELPRTASDNWQPILALCICLFLQLVSFPHSAHLEKDGNHIFFFFFRKILGLQKSLIGALFPDQMQLPGFSVRNVTFSWVLDLSALLTCLSCLYFNISF